MGTSYAPPGCGEYVFDRYVRTKDGAPVCIPCSGYEPAPQRK